MEFLLSPFYRGRSQIEERTPYLCNERYDGGPWGSYPNRHGRPELSQTEGVVFQALEALRIMRVTPSVLVDQESFLQSWLYFGLIAEFLGANSKASNADSSDNTSSEDSPTTIHAQGIIDVIYETLLVQDGELTFVVLDNARLDKFFDMMESTLPIETEARIKRLFQLNSYLVHTQAITAITPKNVGHPLQSSICALGEILMCHTIQRLGARNDPRITARSWVSLDYFPETTKLAMIDNGWCPSDISMCRTKFYSFQTMNLIQKMDKSLPLRDHSRCGEFVCRAHQISLENYQVGHREEGCQCGDTLVVDSEELTRILSRGDQIPLLRIGGGLRDMTIELVESTSDSKYIAISHVWADGLGNPNANALHRCKLLHLRELVAEVAKKINLNQDLGDMSNPLLWLDTLCCPAEDGEGKKKGIEKLYNVYERAEHVLVLDSGLMSYAAEPQNNPERALRIFTSPWIRRLWTLQEGALAKHLHFQFADGTVSLHDLYSAFTKPSGTNLQQLTVSYDVIQQFMNVQAFFHVPGKAGEPVTRDLAYLDRSLKFRGVSVPTDEPLCIGALMRLDLGKIVNVEHKEDRMPMVWSLLAKKMGGLPAPLIFLDRQRIEAVGWRWANRSLLQVDGVQMRTGTGAAGIMETQLGMPTERGLRVTYPGYRISIERYADDKPTNPWPGLPRISEAHAQFRDAQTGKWYYIADKKYASIARSWTDDTRRAEYNKLELFPLHDLANTGHALILMDSSNADGILALPNSGTFKEDLEEGALHIRTERQILVSSFDSKDCYLTDTIRTLALRLRDDKLTDTHLDIYNRLHKESNGSQEVLDDRMREDEELRASCEALKQKAKDMITEVIAEDKMFVQAVLSSSGEPFLQKVWVVVVNYFRDPYIGTKLSSEQVWFVD
jgi:hypothetical protein